MRQRLESFLTCRRGATSIEYAVLAGLMAVAVIAAISILNAPLQGLFTSIAGKFDSE